MGNQRIHQSSVRNAPNQARSSPFAPRPVAGQARQNPQTAPTREEIESEDFTRTKFEAFGLQLQENHGTIAPVGQERLGVLQARMNDYWAQRLEKASRGGYSFAKIPVHAPETRSSVPAQAHQVLPIQRRPTPEFGRPPATPENRTGLPGQLKAGIESLSGASLDHVRVHYNSPRPARLQAHAFARGHEIHVAPGQEKHLPHEAWHVVQQAQGRVKPTMQLMGGVPVNDDGALENEASIMGSKALQPRERIQPSRSAPASPLSADVIQRATALDQRPQIEDQPEFGARKGLSEKPGMELEAGEEAQAAEKGQGEEAEFAPLVRQALARIEEAVQASEDTLQLAAKLEQIKAELGLKAIDMVDLGTPEARVAFEVNPWFYSPVSLSAVIWKMTGTQSTPITDVRWQSEDLTIGTQTAKVGKRMIAKPLAPDHEPGSTSAADSDQDKLMGTLPNAGNTAVPNDQKYIKGHLLNDHVGGPGKSFNLFPITADANAKHLVYVEKFVKAQLASRYVISYEVAVTHGAPNDLGTAMAPGPYDISSRLDFYWHTLGATGTVIGSVHTNRIESDYNKLGSAPFDVTTEYAHEYDKLNLGKSTPKALGQTGQWQTPFGSPMMGPMGTASLASSAITMPTGHFGATVPSTPDFSGIPVKTDTSGAQFISVRNKDAPPSSAVGSTILVGPSSAASTVTIKNINPLSGGWTRIYF